jgi:hypothetical protein
MSLVASVSWDPILDEPPCSLCPHIAPAARVGLAPSNSPCLPSMAADDGARRREKRPRRFTRGCINKLPGKGHLLRSKWSDKSRQVTTFNLVLSWSGRQDSNLRPLAPHGFHGETRRDALSRNESGHCSRNIAFLRI